MKVTQLSVFLENKKGRLQEICSLLGKNDINIRALTIAETESFGVLRIVVDDSEKAAGVLKTNDITANITQVVAVEVPDKPGGLAEVLKVISDNDLNVEYMYGFVEKSSDNALLVFRFDEPVKAADILLKSRVKVVTADEIKGL